MRMMTSPLIPLNLQYFMACSLYTAVFVFFCLILVRSRADGGRREPWLIPFTAGFGLLLLNNCFYTLMWTVIMPGGIIHHPPTWYASLYPVTRLVNVTSQICLACGAFLLWNSYRTIDQTSRNPATSINPPQESTWPPAPSLRR